MALPTLKLRLRERLLTGDHQQPLRPTVDVLDDHDVVVGQLAATRATYNMLPNEPGTITVTVLVGEAKVESYGSR